MNRRFKHIVLLTAACWLLGLSVNAQTSNSPTINGRVFGGGNKAAVYGAVTVDITAGEVKQSVFGGGNEEGIHTNTITGNVGTATLTIDGGTICSDGGDYGVYGGCNTSGTVEGVVTVNINGGTFGSDEDNRIKGIFGGGYGAPTKTASSVEVTIGNSTTTPTIYGDVYGGSAFGDVNSATGAPNNDAHTYVTLKKGSITGNVYGGGLGQQEEGTSGDPNYKPAILAKVWSPVTVTVEGGTLSEYTNNSITLGGKVFGCNNQNGAPQSTVTVNIEKSTAQNAPALSITNVYGGGNLAAYTYSGEGNYPQVNIKNGTVANVFGGGKGADSGDGSIGAVSGNPQVTVQGGTVSEGTYGGGQKANTTGNPSVSITSGSSANLYGGGMAANVTGAPTVTVSGGAVTTGVYGGCNASGNVSGNITVDIIGGTIGSQENLNQNTPVLANVFGGGYGVSTSTSGNVTVNISRATGDNPPAAPTIYGDVYGGSALGSVNAANANPINTTTVNILDGTLVTKEGTDANGFAVYNGGNVFGGGLGESGPANVSKGQVNGTVTVNIGAYEHTGASGGDHTGNIYSGLATIGGSVYGCNNTNGSPQQDVTVNVYQTAHTNGSNNTPNNTFEGTAFAIANVFGGGNLANYAPAASGKKATVNIFSCENTIGRTFGGGNAAEAPEVVTDIKGGRIGQVFGGGNGEVSAANINGAVTIGIHGGTVGQFFGGSNTSGNISGEITIDIDNDGCGSPNINEFFCGGNFADIIGGLSSDITCAAGMTVQGLYGGCNMADVWGDVVLNLYGGIYDYVFGGSKGDVKKLKTTEEPNHINKAANIRKFPTQVEISTAPSGTYPQEVISYLSDAYNNGEDLYGTGGNVTLNLYGGTIKDNAFGGSNVNGNIDGVITVNVLDYEDCELNVKNIYGGCNLTPYTPKDATTVSPVVNVMHIKEGKTITGNVFGGSMGGVVIDSTCLATVTANPQVNIGYDANTMTLPQGYNVVSSADFQAKVAGNVFGGGDLAPVVGSTEVTLQHDNSSAASLFGGGNKADVGGATVNVLDGSVSTGVYGGCNEKGTVNGDIAVNLTSGTIGANGARADVFGGGYGGGNDGTFTNGDIDITLENATVYGDIYGGSAFGSVNEDATKTTTLTINGSALNGTIYGGGKGDVEGETGHSNISATSNGNVIIDYNTVNANLTGLYGGANINGNVKGDIAVNVTANVGSSANNGSMDIFGGGYGEKTETEGDVTVTIKKATGNNATAPVIYGDVYGGSALGKVNKAGASPANLTKVDFQNGELHGTLFGGGMGDNTTSALVNGNTEVAVSAGTISGQIIGQDGNVNVNGAVFGGCNANGTVMGGSTVGLTGGIVGGNENTNHANVYGGGLGVETNVQGSVAVTVGSGSTVHGDVYGGSAMGLVNYAYNNNATPTAPTFGDDVATVVTLNGGTVNGDIYGGGHGLDGESANVGHAVTVNINGGSVNTCDAGNNETFGGNVYGCNNLNGTPKDNVMVNIRATEHGNDSEHNKYPVLPDGVNEWTPEVLAGITQTYAIAAVYGGGNKASYEPAENKSATVHVYNCDNTIKDVYGGGNAANVGILDSDPNTQGNQTISADTYIIIDGGRIHRVFGGGNGEGTTTGANIYGTATTTVKAGLIDQVFGCGNILGTITNTSLNLSKSTEQGACSDEVFCEVFGGANLAPITSNLSTTIGCGVGVIGDLYGGSNLADIGTTDNPTSSVVLTIQGGKYNKVFGGSKGIAGTPGTPANIYGTVELNLEGGEIINAFGGTNAKGNIAGLITVNVEDNGTQGCGLQVDTIYGGGQDASYTPTNASLVSPVVNLLKGTVGQVTNTGTTGCVFGGGKGEGAKVTANPKVIVGGGANTITVNGNVFGGGNLAEVKGTDTVWMKTNGTAGNLFGGGNHALIDGKTVVIMEGGTTDTIFGGGNLAGINSTTKIDLSNGTVNKGVYGGCNKQGTVGGNINVNVTGGTIGSNTTRANIHGGGYGQQTATSGNVTVTYGAKTNTHSDFPTLTGDLYGGSALGNVGVNGKTTTVNVLNGNITGSVYGGGLGSDQHAAAVNGDVEVYVGKDIEGTVYNKAVLIPYTIGDTQKGGNVFGCNNVNGAPTGDVSVDFNGGTVTNIFGGGNLAEYTGDPVVNINDGTVSGNVFGGGKGELASGDDRGQKGKVTGDPQVTIGDNDSNHTAQVKGDVYGGGDAANVDGTPVVVVNKCNTTIGYLYGGGNAADVEGTDVTVNGGTITQAFGGGHGDKTVTTEPLKYADVNGDVAFNVHGGTIAQVFAGSNSKGTITGTTDFTINKTNNACAMKLGEVYGGGNEADGNAGTVTIICTGDWTDAHNNHNTTDKRIGYDLEGIGTVYGGANAADVNNGIVLDIKSGIINNVFGGNNQSGTISGTIQVNIEKDATAVCADDWYVGNVYGGGNLAAYDNSGSYPEVNIKNGTVSGDVFGGGLGATAKVRSNPVVTVGDLDHSNYVAAVTGNVYGGGSAAMVGDDDANNPSTNNTTVLIQKSNTTVAKVFGGGMEAGVTGTTGVTIADGTITDGVYGGCDNSGLVKGNITVDVTGGTIGSEDKLINSNPPVTTDVFGGGYGVSTSTAGDVTVTISKASGEGAPAAPTIYGDVYGGSAFGTVNDDANDKTTVNIMDGIIKSNPETLQIPSTILYYTVYHGGNVYGGGLGQKQEGTLGQSGYKPAIEAKEYGEIIVNIGEPARTRDEFPPDVYNGNAVIEGNIYGCNNANGTPLDKVTVNVYKTHREATDEWDYTPASSATYALNDVFGGGNEANYLPAEAGKSVSVLIHGCYNTAERVFGGSNAAAAGSNSLNVVVNTTIDGGRYAEVYGGGNGERGSNYAADIFGNVNLAIHGGNVNQFFVGSNQHGTITGQSTVGIDNESCVSVNVDEFFCGGNYADFVGNIDAEITCSEGMSVKNLYGGCNQANVVAVEGSSTLVGNVTLTVWGGTFENVYGGSKGRADNDPQGPMSANIDGSVILNIYGGTITNAIYGGCNVKGLVKGGITVNVEDKNTADDCPLDVSTADVYGGGNLADYAPTKPNTTDYPHVNIKKATVKNVFGGGYNAKVTGNPQIKIKKGAKILGNVYGGGNMGEVDGSPKVTVNAKDESTNE